MKKRYLFGVLLLLLILSITAVLLIAPKFKLTELEQLRAEGWSIIELDGVAERKGDFSLDYSKATEGNPPVSAGGMHWENQPPPNPTGPLQVSESRPPTVIGIKIIDNKLTLAIPGTETIRFGNRSTLQQFVDLFFRGRSPDAIATFRGKRFIPDSSRPPGHTAKLLPIPGDRIPFNQPVRVVEWIPDDPSKPVEFGFIQLGPITPRPSNPSPAQPPEP